ncbi:hypothetical protein C8F01DRAFT_7224 [Mycena amicta]|nr:hypothetical protein C8F01DRAFT_7224 [Mycena amicta]
MPVTMHSLRASDGFHITVPVSDAPSSLLCYEYDADILRATLRSSNRRVKGPQGRERWTVSMDVYLLQSLVLFLETESGFPQRDCAAYQSNPIQSVVSRRGYTRARTTTRNAFVARMVTIRSGMKVKANQVQARLTALKRTPVEAVRRLIEFSSDGTDPGLPTWITDFDRSTSPSRPEPQMLDERIPTWRFTGLRDSQVGPCCVSAQSDSIHASSADYPILFQPFPDHVGLGSLTVADEESPPMCWTCGSHFPQPIGSCG